MPQVKCTECGAGVDITKDGEYGHCASCNTVGLNNVSITRLSDGGQIVEIKKAEKVDDSKKSDDKKNETKLDAKATSGEPEDQEALKKVSLPSN